MTSADRHVVVTHAGYSSEPELPFFSSPVPGNACRYACGGRHVRKQADWRPGRVVTCPTLALSGMDNPGALAALIVEAIADPLLGLDGKCES
jgi:hypothetical protein